MNIWTAKGLNYVFQKRTECYRMLVESPPHTIFETIDGFCGQPLFFYICVQQLYYVFIVFLIAVCCFSLMKCMVCTENFNRQNCTYKIWVFEVRQVKYDDVPAREKRGRRRKTDTETVECGRVGAMPYCSVVGHRSVTSHRETSTDPGHHLSLSLISSLRS